MSSDRPRDFRGRFVSRTASPGAVTNILRSRTPTSSRTVSSSEYRDIVAAAESLFSPNQLLSSRQLRTALYNPETPSSNPSARTRALLTMPDSTAAIQTLRAAAYNLETPLDPARALNFSTRAATVSARTQALLSTPDSAATIQTLRDFDDDTLSDYMATLPVQKRKEFIKTFGSLVARDIPTAIELFRDSDKPAYRRVTSIPTGARPRGQGPMR